MNKYIYDGPVKEFDRIVTEHWKASTYAVSEKKARSNLAFQYKRENGLLPRTMISLPGKIVIAE